MGVSKTIEYAQLGDLYLDPKNPRLGHARIGEGLSQADLLEVMKDWSLEELAVSYLEGGGFWTYEALIAVKEELEGEERLVVVEGNRRLAALRLLQEAYETPQNSTKKWVALTEAPAPPELFTQIPYLLADSRKDVDSFLGFRHVTGIKEWHPAEKASYIARLIDGGLTFHEVMRRIGSKTPTVRRQYIAHQIQQQIEELVEDVPPQAIEDRFSVMYLSLRSKGVQEYLGINTEAEEGEAKAPVPDGRQAQLARYAVWMFGTEDRPPLFSDSRLTDRFGAILASEEGREYLERNERPSFELAYQRAGGEEPEIVEELTSAADSVELALSTVHLYAESPRVMKVVARLTADLRQLERVFARPEAKA